jgi:hypothetical protein
MKNMNAQSKYSKKILLIIITIICSICLTNCSTKPAKYFFYCNKQNPDIINTYIPNVLFEIGYEAKKNDTVPNSFIATKKIVSRNFSKGIESEYVLMRINFMYDSTQSFLTQHHIREFNGRKRVSALNDAQLKIYEPDANLFIERMYFYCNPNFQGR